MNEHEAWIQGTKMCRELDIDEIVMRTLKGFADNYHIGDLRQQLRTDLTATDFINNLRIPVELKSSYITQYQQLKN